MHVSPVCSGVATVNAGLTLHSPIFLCGVLPGVSASFLHLFIFSLEGANRSITEHSTTIFNCQDCSSETAKLFRVGDVMS